MTPLEPKWLTAVQVARLNEIIVEATGETHLIMSRELLESAVARPNNLWLYENESDLVVLAVRLLEGIGKNHCFQQGNKRTAFHAAMSFLALNGQHPTLPDTQDVAVLVEGIIVGRDRPEALIELLRAHPPAV